MAQMAGRVSGQDDLLNSAAFTLLLIGHLPAIAPLYGRFSEPFCALEAGEMCHLLERAATEEGIAAALPCGPRARWSRPGRRLLARIVGRAGA